MKLRLCNYSGVVVCHLFSDFLSCLPFAISRLLSFISLTSYVSWYWCKFHEVASFLNCQHFFSNEQCLLSQCVSKLPMYIIYDLAVR